MLGMSSPAQCAVTCTCESLSRVGCWLTCAVVTKSLAHLAYMRILHTDLPHSLNRQFQDLLVTMPSSTDTEVFTALHQTQSRWLSLCPTPSVPPPHKHVGGTLLVGLVLSNQVTNTHWALCTQHTELSARPKVIRECYARHTLALELARESTGTRRCLRCTPVACGAVLCFAEEPGLQQGLRRFTFHVFAPCTCYVWCSPLFIEQRGLKRG